jgi:hypothetical protein
VGGFDLMCGDWRGFLLLIESCNRFMIITSNLLFYWPSLCYCIHPIFSEYFFRC